MRPRLLLLICISLALICCGALWYGRSLSSGDRYDCKEDMKRTFLTPHWKYSGYLNDGRPRRVVPAMLILAGIALLVAGLMKLP